MSLSGLHTDFSDLDRLGSFAHKLENSQGNAPADFQEAALNYLKERENAGSYILSSTDAILEGMKNGFNICAALLFIFFPIFLSATAVRAEGLFTPVVGIVVAVTPNSELLLDDADSPLNLGDTVLVKQWSLDISPEQLELLTFGREVHCSVVSQNEEYL